MVLVHYHWDIGICFSSGKDVDEGSVAAVMSSDVDIGLKVKKSIATQSRTRLGSLRMSQG